MKGVNLEKNASKLEEKSFMKLSSDNVFKNENLRN